MLSQTNLLLDTEERKVHDLHNVSRLPHYRLWSLSTETGRVNIFHVESSGRVAWTMVITVFNLFLSVSLALFNCNSFALIKVITILPYSLCNYDH